MVAYNSCKCRSSCINLYFIWNFVVRQTNTYLIEGGLSQCEITPFFVTRIAQHPHFNKKTSILNKNYKLVYSVKVFLRLLLHLLFTLIHFFICETVKYPASLPTSPKNGYGKQLSWNKSQD